jgi:transcriptional regulator with XRE-family HTH domain
MESVAVTFGKRVKALREARQWTQEDLAKAANLGTKHIGVIERGEKTSSFDAVEKLARALGVEYYELFIPHHRRTENMVSEINRLLRDASEISTSDIEEFLRGLRAALKKLDRRPSA